VPPQRETLSLLVARSGGNPQSALLGLDLLLTDCGLTERFLRTRSGWLRDDERELAESWQHIPIGLFEVREIQRGTGLTVRPLPGGEPVFLKDRLFSTSARRLTCSAAGSARWHAAAPARAADVDRPALAEWLRQQPHAQLRRTPEDRIPAQVTHPSPSVRTHGMRQIRLPDRYTQQVANQQVSMIVGVPLPTSGGPSVPAHEPRSADSR
jgi:hypothetical protein